MSGVKETAILYAVQTATLLAYAAATRAAQIRRNQLVNRLQACLQQTDAAIRRQNADLIDKAEVWLQRHPVNRPIPLFDTRDLNMLSTLRDMTQQEVAEGERLLSELEAALASGERALHRLLSNQLGVMEQRVAGNREALSAWGIDHTEQWQTRLIKTRQLLDSEQWAQAEHEIEQLNAAIDAAEASAEALEQKHQQRLYLLQAIRQVCADMGFTEVDTPAFQTEGVKTTPITFTVDTWDRGVIQFLLRLDGLTVHTDIAQSHCFEEFSQLSDYLSEQYGIQTSFQMPEGADRPRLRQRGEMEEPSGLSAEQPLT